MDLGNTGFTKVMSTTGPTVKELVIQSLAPKGDMLSE